MIIRSILHDDIRAIIAVGLNGFFSVLFIALIWNRICLHFRKTRYHPRFLVRFVMLRLLISLLCFYTLVCPLIVFRLFFFCHGFVSFWLSLNIPLLSLNSLLKQCLSCPFRIVSYFAYVMNNTRNVVVNIFYRGW